MSARKVTEILLAVVAVWGLLEAIPVIAWLLVAAASGLPGSSAVGAGLLPSVTAQLVVNVAVNAAVLIGRGRIAGWLAPDTEPVSHDAHEWQTAALAVLGAYFVVRGLSNVVGEVIGRPMNMIAASWESIGSGVVQAGLGTGLFLGAPGVSRLWHRLRGPGRNGGSA